MPLHIARYCESESGPARWGVVQQQQVLPIEAEFSSTAEFLAHGRPLALDVAQGKTEAEPLALDRVQLLSPVTKPCRVICQGANYRQHMEESGLNPDDKKFNMLFNKSSASVSDPHAGIRRPAHVQLLDYEVELGLVIGAPLDRETQVTKDNLHQWVAGIVIGNDVSARDVQVPQMQFFKGKSYRSFCPVGPFLCLLEPSEMHYLEQLELKLTVNDQPRQQDVTQNLVFKPAETLSEISQISDLDPGDLILTGTPAGCAMQAPPAAVVRLSGLLPEPVKWKLFVKMQKKKPNYLKPGDLVRATIKSLDEVIDLGEQRNRVE